MFCYRYPNVLLQIPECFVTKAPECFVTKNPFVKIQLFILKRFELLKLAKNGVGDKLL